MTITVGIRNFRSYLTHPQDTEGGYFRFKFEEGVNLLKGGSGTGKSTVLMAISWCLYKKPALGNTPLYKDSTRGETTVFFHVENEIRVVRRSPGSLLTVTILDDPSEPTLENEEAQNYIYRRFGRETVWKTCNYVQQGSTNPMISGELNEAQRWDVLYGITLDTDPQNRITIDRLKHSLKISLDTCSAEKQRVENELKLHTLQLNEREEELLHLREKLSAIKTEKPYLEPLLERRDVQWRAARGLYERVSLHPYVGEADLESRQGGVREIENQIEEIEGKISECQKNYTVLKEDYERARGGVVERCSAVESEVREWRKRDATYRSKLEWYRGIREGIRKMCGGGSSLLGYVEGEIRATSFSEYQGRVCRLVGKILWMQQTLKTACTLQDLETPIGELEKKISLIGLFEKRSELGSRVKALEAEILGGWRDGEWRELFEKRSLQEWLPILPENSLHNPLPSQVAQLIICPCCDKRLRITLDKSSGKILSTEHWTEQKRVPKALLEKIQEHDRVLKSWNDLPNLETPILPKQFWMDILSKAQKWQGEPEPLRKLVLKLFPEARVEPTEYSEFQAIQASVIDYPLFLSMDEKPLEEWSKTIRELEVERERLKEELNVLQSRYEDKVSTLRLNETPRLTTLKMELEARLREERRNLEQMEGIRRIWRRVSELGFFDRPFPHPSEWVSVLGVVGDIVERRNKLLEDLGERRARQTGLKTEFEGLVAKTETVHRLQFHLEEVETEVLTESVQKISRSANDFLENCFENPVLVQLTTEKESKTGKAKKHSVNLTIRSGKKDGALLERGLDGFSGGETDRISLGFSSAITAYSPFPMLLLDECISSLDSDMKDKTIRALRQQAKRLNKTIVLICHDAVEGLFDHVCELE